MWKVEDPVIRRATLDFGSSGQSRLDVSQLFSGDVLLVNAIEFVDWESDETQFLVCEACGHVHCKTGDWVSVRQSGSLILVLPAFDSLQENDVEYSPPVYLRNNGIGFLDLITYEKLLRSRAALPGLNSILPLKMKEAIMAFRWESPFKIFSRPGTVTQSVDLIVGSSNGDHKEWLRSIDRILNENATNSSAVTLRPLREDEEAVSLFLDTAEFVE